jgi:hypothetical protein
MEELVAIFVHPDEYVRHLNQVASLTTRDIVFLKRKFVSKSGSELVNYSVKDCVGIIYEDKLSFLAIIFGLLLVLLVAAILYMLVVYWSDLQPQTRVPIGAIAIAGLYGLRWLFGSRRHKITFVLKDKTALVWESRLGDHKSKRVSVQKVVEFAKSAGLLRPSH